MARKLLLPEAARELLARRFNNQREAWLSGSGDWPLRLSLGVPTESDAVENAAGVRVWVDAWAGWREAGDVLWEERRWGRLGTQRLPVAFRIESPKAVASLVGEGEPWGRVAERHGQLVKEWPILAAGAAQQFDALADLSMSDFERVRAFLAWMDGNRASGLYLRQLPIEGLDTKWVERHSALVSSLMRLLRGRGSEEDLYDLCGLRRPPYRIRIRVLCPELRRLVGGLADLEVPVGQLAGLEIAPRVTLIVENLETGVALPDVAGAVAFMKLGNAVSQLEAVRWIQRSFVVYWGDIDTHGFAILDRARRICPTLKSLLMDQDTLCSHRHLWGQEPVQHPDVELPQLTDGERDVYSKLRSNEFGPRVRLEQERIAWPVALEALRVMLGSSSE